MPRSTVGLCTIINVARRARTPIARLRWTLYIQLMNVGLLYTPVSIYQMTRGALVLFVGVLSVIFLRRRLWLYQLSMLFLFTSSLASGRHAQSPYSSDHLYLLIRIQVDLAPDCDDRDIPGRLQWVAHQGCCQGECEFDWPTAFEYAFSG